MAVTGAASGLGGALLTRLADRDAALGDLVGIDVVAGPAPAQWRLADVRDPTLAQRLTGVDVLVHLATSYDVDQPAAARRAVNVRGTVALLDAARLARVRRVVLVTSAEVYGALPDNPVPLQDAAPRRAPADDVTLTGDHVEVERLADHAARTGLEVDVLRPATLVGGPLGPAYDGHVLRRLAAPRLLATRGHEPLWQLCHVEDLVSALEVVVDGRARGGLAVASQGWLEQARVEAVAGKRRLELPPAVALSTAERLHRYGVTTSSRRELDHVLAPLVVAADGLQAAGWRPAWSNEEALRAHLATRPGRTGGLGAAGTAAGTAVALVGTAALVRRRRRRR